MIPSRLSLAAAAAVGGPVVFAIQAVHAVWLVPQVGIGADESFCRTARVSTGGPPRAMQRLSRRRLTGGKKRLPDRFDQLARISLVLQGKRADNVLQFQVDQRLDLDVTWFRRLDRICVRRSSRSPPGEAARPEVKVAPAVEGEPSGVWLPGHGLSHYKMHRWR